VSRKHGFYLNFKREVLWLRGDDSGAGCIYQLAGNTRYIMFFHARNRFESEGLEEFPSAGSGRTSCTYRYDRCFGKRIIM
jgi:hypothetical protein